MTSGLLASLHSMVKGAVMSTSTASSLSYPQCCAEEVLKEDVFEDDVLAEDALEDTPGGDVVQDAPAEDAIKDVFQR